MSAAAARVLLAAGGTGGHLFPAEALASELIARGCAVALVTDRRGGGFGDRMAGVETHRISAGGLAGTGIARRAQGVLQLGVGLIQARRLIGRLKPQLVVGFGGYPSVPPVLAASLAGVATLLHEQNAILGRANRLLARRATRLAASFAAPFAGIAPDRIAVTGNPVRPAIAALADEPYHEVGDDGAVHLLVTGGSQGARVFGRLLPAAVEQLPAEIRRRLRLAQQCRAEDLAAVRAVYDRLGVAAELAPFFADMPARLRRAQLVVARAGASTVAELTAAGRPASLVPYPFATDDHQTANARAVSAAGAGWLMPETSLNPETLAGRLTQLIGQTALLTAAAAAARAAGRRDAARLLADLVVALLPGNGKQAEAAGRREAAA